MWQEIAGLAVAVEPKPLVGGIVGGLGGRTFLARKDADRGSCCSC